MVLVSSSVNVFDFLIIYLVFNPHFQLFMMTQQLTKYFPYFSVNVNGSLSLVERQIIFQSNFEVMFLYHYPGYQILYVKF